MKTLLQSLLGASITTHSESFLVCSWGRLRISDTKQCNGKRLRLRLHPTTSLEDAAPKSIGYDLLHYSKGQGLHPLSLCLEEPSAQNCKGYVALHAKYYPSSIFQDQDSKTKTTVKATHAPGLHACEPQTPRRSRCHRRWSCWVHGWSLRAWQSRADRAYAQIQSNRSCVRTASALETEH